jgi:hypothetical protein
MKQKRLAATAFACALPPHPKKVDLCCKISRASFAEMTRIPLEDLHIYAALALLSYTTGDTTFKIQVHLQPRTFRSKALRENKGVTFKGKPKAL